MTVCFSPDSMLPCYFITLAVLILMYSDGVMRHFTLSVLYDVPCVANAVNNSHIVMNALG